MTWTNGESELLLSMQEALDEADFCLKTRTENGTEVGILLGGTASVKSRFNLANVAASCHRVSYLLSEYQDETSLRLASEFAELASLFSMLDSLHYHYKDMTCADATSPENGKALVFACVFKPAVELTRERLVEVRRRARLWRVWLRDSVAERSHV